MINKNLYPIMFALAFFVLFSSSVLAPGVEYGYDKCEYNGGWSEPNSSAAECGWPPGEEGFKEDCCCCYLTSHIHDMNNLFQEGTVEIEYMPGLYKDCTSTMNVYYSEDGLNWVKFYDTTVNQPTWSPKTTFTKTITVPSDFQYIKINIPNCYVDYSSARVVYSNYTTTTTMSDSCTDTDGYDIQKKGKVYGYHNGEYYKYWDFCNVTSVVEYYCDGNSYKFDVFDCLVNFTTCTDGACTGGSEENVCTDTDGGKKYYVKGKISGKKIHDDLLEEDSCVGDKVKELFCNEDGVAEPYLYKCPNGCKDGACIGEAEEAKFCHDTDGGLNYYVKGTVSQIENDYATGEIFSIDDSCDGDKLTEWICEDDKIEDEYYNCPHGCKNGACIGEAEEENDCDELSKNFDDKIENIMTECLEWDEKHIWVGGTLTDISKNYNSAYKRYEYTLTFKGYEKKGKIIIGTSKAIPYKINQFYKFDLGNVCKLIYSSASSGMFYDPNLDALQFIDCKTTEKEEVPTACSGCWYDTSCVAYGTRVIYEELPSYCNLEGELKVQKENKESCMNNYECKSNFCSDGFCYDIRGEIQETKGILELIMDFLRKMFLFGD